MCRLFLNVQVIVVRESMPPCFINRDSVILEDDNPIVKMIDVNHPSTYTCCHFVLSLVFNRRSCMHLLLPKIPLSETHLAAFEPVMGVTILGYRLPDGVHL